jgi:hypothetical protein
MKLAFLKSNTPRPVRGPESVGGEIMDALSAQMREILDYGKILKKI